MLLFTNRNRFLCLTLKLFTGSIARSARRRYLIYPEADFEVFALEVFAPAGRHVAPMGVKYGMEEGNAGPLLHAKFHPIGAMVRV